MRASTCSIVLYLLLSAGYHNQVSTHWFALCSTLIPGWINRGEEVALSSMWLPAVLAPRTCFIFGEITAKEITGYFRSGSCSDFECEEFWKTVWEGAGTLLLGLVFSLSVRLRDLEGNRQRNSILPLWRKPPQCSQDPCGDSSHSLRLNSDPPLAKSQNDPRPPLRRGPSHLPGIISSPPT